MNFVNKCFALASAVALVFLASTAYAYPPMPRSVLAPAASTSGWSSDAATNLAVGYGNAGQAQPKIVPTANGGVWISWFDNSQAATKGQHFNARIQRLDMLGNPLLGPNGMLVAPRYFSSTQDYGLDVDADGNAVLAFRIDSSANPSTALIEAQMVKPNGTLAWGPVNATTGIPEGIRLGDPASFNAMPDIAATSDGDYVVAWIANNSIDVVRLDADGNPVWASPVVLSDPGGAELALGGLHGANDGSVILSYVKEGGFLGPKQLYAQKLNANGNPLWGAAPGLPIFDGGSLQFGHFPDFIPDGAGGAVFVWYSSSPALQTYVQHVSSDGTEMFPHNGVLVSTDTVNIEVSPTAAYDPGSGDIFVAWTQADARTQGNVGISAQMIGPDGSRAWGDKGIIIVPQKPNMENVTSVAALGDSALIFYSRSDVTGVGQIYATRIGTNGKAVWSPSPINVSSTPSDKFRLNSIIATNGMAVLTWQDGAPPNSDILAQNVNIDGRLGNHTPVASDAKLIVDENTIAHGTLKATSPDGDSITFAIVDKPKHGAVTLDDVSTGAYTYTPDADYSGSDSFTFMAGDGAINSNVARISITVVNKAPVASDGTLTTNENTAASGNLKATDPEGDTLTYIIVSQPTHGKVKLDNAATGAYTYTPDTGFSGDDSFTFKASDGTNDSNTAAVSITVVNKPPVASDGTLTTKENNAAGGTLKAKDPEGATLTYIIVSQPTHGKVKLDNATTGAYTYTPDSGFSGSDGFTFKASDGTNDSNTATISITVNAVTPPPPPPPDNDSGGGAAAPLGLALLLGLAGLIGLLRRRKRVR